MVKVLKIALIAGGPSAERAISLESGRYLAQGLQKLEQDFIFFDWPKDLLKLARAARNFDLAWPIVHGAGGEDGSLQGFLRTVGLPFIGSGVLGAAQTFDKAYTKKVYQDQGIKVASGLVVAQGQKVAGAKILEQVGLPCFVKPIKSGSSFGAGLVTQQCQLKEALAKAWQFGEALVEQFLVGTEVAAGVLQTRRGLRALPLVEIQPKAQFFDYQAKYDPNFCTEICPARIGAGLTQRVQELALRIHNLFNLRHLSRTDFILVGSKIYALETNTIPGFTKNSLFPQAAAKAGFSFEDLVGEILEVWRRGV